MRSLLGPLWRRVLDAIAPRRCLGCDVVCAEPWCPACGPPRAPAKLPDVGGVPLLAAGAYEGALGRAIRRYKYSRRSDLAEPLAQLLAPHARSLAPLTPVWIPVPLHPRRLVERGFNQSALLARSLARVTRARCSTTTLVRVRHTERQATLGRAARETNVVGAFAVRGDPPKRVVLVDDVLTSGLTALGCIRVLRESGAEVCAVVALAVAGADASLTSDDVDGERASAVSPLEALIR